MRESTQSGDMSAETPDNSEILSAIKKLEERISHLEDYLNIEPKLETEPVKITEQEEAEFEDKEEELEYRIGQYWFAKVGVVALVIGMAFFLTFPYKNLPAVLPGLFGYFLASTFFAAGYFGRKNFHYITGFLIGDGLTLIYFTTMRLFYFGHKNLVNDISLEVLLLTIVVIFNLTISLRRKSIYLTALSLTFGYATAVISDQPYFIFTMISLISILAVYLKLKNQWKGLIFYGIIFSYLIHFVWFINNPLLGKAIQTIPSPQMNLIFLLFYSSIFAFGNLLRSKEEPENIYVILSSGVNAFLSYGLLSLITLSIKPEYLFFYHLLSSIVFLALAFAFWIKEKSRYSTFFYAMFGYLALSVAIISQFSSPLLFIWLCWQSLLVISTAVWFRSKFIVVANFIIYLIIFIAYLAVEGKVDLISVSFGIVALLSARVLNWKKDRLELKTEQMRNAYLLSALFIIPYALYFAMPESLISVSWIVVAIIYYILSIVLKNKKYRWMALLTLLLTVGYVFIIGITNSDATYKIVSFIALGTVLIVVSLSYTKLRKSLKNILKM